MNEEGKIRHLFLTGPVQTGKSTIIRRFLKTTGLPPEQLGGFLSAVREEADGKSRVHLVRPGVDETLDEQNCIMIRQPGRREKREFPLIFPEVFDRRGVELLRPEGNRALILMDELGFAEEKAPLFKKTVLETLDGEIPVLGVLKKWSGDFLGRVAAHPRVTVLEINRDNREDIFSLMAFVWKIKETT